MPSFIIFLIFDYKSYYASNNTLRFSIIFLRFLLIVLLYSPNLVKITVNFTIIISLLPVVEMTDLLENIMDQFPAEILKIHRVII